MQGSLCLKKLPDLISKIVRSGPYSILCINCRHELDLASERLSVELKRLDRHVSTAVIDHATTVFADAELPVHNMIQAATAPLLVRLEIVKEHLRTAHDALSVWSISPWGFS